MNQAMPRWRTLSSDDAQEPSNGQEPEKPSDAPRRRLLATLAIAGGIALGGVLVLLVTMVSSTSPGVDLADIGEPLEPNPGTGMEVMVAGDSASPPDVDELVVDVAGAVSQPGLYRLRPGQRVGDAIAAAGGFGPRVDLRAASEALNLAQPLDDGMKILVPELGIDDAPVRAESDGRIDLNRASQQDLETLPGIGPVTAGKIIEARSAARFESVRDLRTREVVGQSVFEDIQGLVRVSS